MMFPQNRNRYKPTNKWVLYSVCWCNINHYNPSQLCATQKHCKYRPINSNEEKQKQKTTKGLRIICFVYYSASLECPQEKNPIQVDCCYCQLLLTPCNQKQISGIAFVTAGMTNEGHIIVSHLAYLMISKCKTVKQSLNNNITGVIIDMQIALYYHCQQWNDTINDTKTLA